VKRAIEVLERGETFTARNVSMLKQIEEQAETQPPSFSIFILVTMTPRDYNISGTRPDPFLPQVSLPPFSLFAATEAVFLYFPFQA
jgi:hypothetical protein